MTSSSTHSVQHSRMPIVYPRTMNLASRVAIVARQVFNQLGKAFPTAVIVNLFCIRWQIIVAGTMPAFFVWHIATLALLTLGLSTFYACKKGFSFSSDKSSY